MPMQVGDLNFVTVHGTYKDFLGNPISGSVTFTPAVTLADPMSDLFLVPRVFQVPLSQGHFSVDLPATDDPDITPTGWTYAVTENFSSGGRTYSISVPLATGPSVSLAVLAPAAVPPSSGTTEFTPLAAFLSYINNGPIVLHHMTAAQWTAANPILAAGELGIETDTRSAKIGDGGTAYNGLPYAFTGGSGGGSGFTLTRVAVQSNDYTTAANQIVPINTTTHSVTVTLPSAPLGSSLVVIRHILQGGTNTITVAAAGTDVFNQAGGPTSFTMNKGQDEAVMLEYDATAKIWTQLADYTPGTTVTSFNTRTGPITLSKADVTGTGLTAGDIGALPNTTTYVASFNSRTGVVALTKTDVTNTGLSAADVGALPSSTTYVGSFNGRTGVITLTKTDVTNTSLGPADIGAAAIGRLISTGAGLAGGGDLSADRTLSVLYGTTANTATVGNDARFTQVAANTQTASYVLALADAGAVVEMNVATANTLTVPPNSSVAFPVGTVIEVSQYGVGQVTITAGVGVTVRTSSSLTTRAQYSVVGLRKRAADEWVLSGDLS